MSIPLDVALTLVVICSCLALIVGVCIRTPPEPAPDLFKPVALHALKQLEADEQPTVFKAWTPELRSRFYHQEAAARYRLQQLAKADQQVDLAA
jgi:hypothetical protein